MCCAIIFLGGSSGSTPPVDDGYYDDYASGGDVCWKQSGAVPDGWIVMSIADVKRNQAKCRGTLGDWDIVALQDGTIDGKGYGYKYHQNDSRRCTIGTKLLMEDDGRLDRDAFINC